MTSKRGPFCSEGDGEDRLTDGNGEVSSAGECDMDGAFNLHLWFNSEWEGFPLRVRARDQDHLR